MGPVALILPRGDEFYGRGVNLAVISLVFTAVAILLVCSRLATRRAVGQALGGCDYSITISLVRLYLKVLLRIHTQLTPSPSCSRLA